ncbi:outer membrane beta-barrel protein [Mucilaginibacter sp. AW1-3]
MKSITHYFFSLYISVITLLVIFSPAPAYSQIDFFYGKNTHGLRIGGGVGATWLATHYNTNPAQLTYVGNLDYNFNPYFSIGIEGQYGTLKGVDTHEPPHLYYTSSTNKFASVNINIKAGVGLIDDFYPNNAFQDAVKRIYIGVGYGTMKNKIALTTEPTLEAYAYGTPQPYAYVPTVPFNLGTYIDLPNVFGYDRLEINPNYQLTYIPSMYSDGFISNQYSHLKGFYNMVSLSLKYKF